MKILSLLFISLLFNLQSFGQYTLVPDSNFEQALIDLEIDSGIIDGVVLTINIIDITFLDVHSKQIKDLTGIEDFSSLESLFCRDNQLINLNISNNPLLGKLSCEVNRLTVLDLSHNAILTDLNCRDNQLTTLDLNSNPLLEDLNCGRNPLNSLILTNNPQLQTLWCQGITDSSFVLDVSLNTFLTQIYCGYNNFHYLDVSKNTQLTNLYCPNNSILNLDVSQNVELTSLNCGTNLLRKLNVSQNSLLTSLYCGGNNLKELSLEFNPKLKRIWFDNNQIASINLSDKHDLKSISCGGNPITCLNIAASKTTVEKFRLRAYNSTKLACVEIGKMDTSLFTTLQIDSGLTLEGNCVNDCSSPFDTTDVANANISIYPNPTNGEVTINFNKEIVRDLEISLLNIIGQEVKRYKASYVSDFNLEINGSSGLYFLVLKTNSSDPIVYKIIKH